MARLRRLRGFIPPHRSLPSFERFAQSDIVRHYLVGAKQDIPFTRVIVRALNMLLYFAVIGNVEGFRLGAGKIAEAARREGVDVKKAMGGDIWICFRAYVESLNASSAANIQMSSNVSLENVAHESIGGPTHNCNNNSSPALDVGMRHSRYLEEGVN